MAGKLKLKSSDASQLKHSPAQIKMARDMMAKAGYELKQSEGNGSGTWVLLDYEDIIVHVFDKDNRLFYNLERIRSDGKRVEL